MGEDGSSRRVYLQKRLPHHLQFSFRPLKGYKGE